MKKSVIMLSLAATVFGASAAQAATTNLIQNGDFSTNSVAPGNYAYANGHYGVLGPVPNWTFSGASGIIDHSTDWGSGANVGNELAFIQSYDGFTIAPSISQTFASTSSAFVVSFDLAKRLGHGGVESLKVTLDGISLVNGLLATSGSLSNYSYSIFGLTGGTHTLKFEGITPNAPGVDSSVFIDNVSVAAVPEPETYAMLLAGLGLMGGIARRRKQK